MAFKDKEVSCFEMRGKYVLNCVYPTSSTPYEIAVCVVTGKQIAEHHDIVCETPAWAIAYHKKKGHHRIDHHDEVSIIKA